MRILIPQHPLIQYGTWLLRLAVLLLLCTGLVAPRARALLGAPQTVVTREPKLCVHTRLIDEVFEWRILKTLEMARDMGATTLVEFFPWAYVEDVKSQYNWARTDMIIRYARHNGLKVIARLGLVPEWARAETGKPSTFNTLPMDADPYFARYAAEFASRYERDVEAIIIWNEPNLAFEWGFDAIDPSRYASLVQTVYDTVKQAAPSMKVLVGALAPTLEPQGSPNGLNDLIYLQALYDAGIANYHDGLAIHTYGFTHPAEAAPAPDDINFRRAELLYEVMQRNGDTHKPVYITETGWNDHPRWALSVRPAQRVQYTLDALDIANQEWPWLQTLCLWVFRTPAATNSYPDGFTLLTTGFEPKPLYIALRARAVTHQEESLTWLPSPRAAQQP